MVQRFLGTDKRLNTVLNLERGRHVTWVVADSYQLGSGTPVLKRYASNSLAQ